MGGSAGLRHGIRVLVGLAVVAVIATMILAVYSSVRANDAAAERANRLDPAATVTAQLYTAFVDQRSALRGYLISAGANDQLLDPFRDAETNIPLLTVRMRSLVADFPDLLTRVDTLSRTYQTWRDGVVQSELDEAAGGNALAAQLLEISDVSLQRFRDLRTANEGLTKAIADEQSAATGRVKNSADLLLTSVGTVVAVLLAMSLLMLVLSRRWLILPINELRRAVNAVAAGRHDTTIPAVGPREIVDLAGNVEAMRAQLVSLVRQNERSWEALAQEGPAVMALRDALTPSSLRDTAGLELLGRVDPAEGALAGDWFDAIEMPDGRVAIVVGDVAGHGAASGVFALRLKQLLTASLSRGSEPATAVQWVVEALGDTDETFATVLIALIDPVDGEVIYANAGHPDALVLRAGRSTAAGAGARTRARAAAGYRAGYVGGRDDFDEIDEIEDLDDLDRLEDLDDLDKLDDGDGLGDVNDLVGLDRLDDLDDPEGLDRLAGLGLVEPLESTGPLMSSLVAEPGAWRTGRLRLRHGDVLFVYTDGLVEARDDGGRLFGRHRLVGELIRVSGRSPDRLLDDVFAAVRSHAPGRPSDDRTAIALSLSPAVPGARRART
ncbi:SpoIIE family protein phosphatase [Pseudofrankia sp. BMG5.36]|uniref:PP2C family protein-serine/threonine phosphatase n=1 Tax=Pseudofrankia sp. BMG5.36 TaxID=1834512 RepID=UPI0008D93F78|nr:SpoIIE family protein phosphatase [Pseudofrankia sp. BMG5.36]OHV47600.1 hypothetical protein BCD48_18010 [Pseudofrankia sp. BMG5.36]